MAEPDVKHTSNRATRLTRRSFFTFVLFVVTVLVVPLMFGRTSTVHEFDSSLVDEFLESEAEVVFLGNSLLDTRINPELGSESTGSTAVSMAIDGTAPGVWYLQLSNVIAESQMPPESAFIFFHDDLITRPIYFTGVEDRSLVESLSKSTDESEQLPKSKSSFGDQLASAFSGLYPLANSHQRRAHSPISSIGGAISGIDASMMESRSDSFFSPVNFRDRGSLIQQPKFHGEFGKVIDDSFLPLIIESAISIGTELVFVRVAARPFDDGTPNEPGSLRRYSNELSDYLADHGVTYIDMIDHVESGIIDATTYYDGYHLKHRFRDHYTELFADWMLNEFDNETEFGADR